MAIKTPTINRIIRMTQWDLMHTSINPGNMYMCIDNTTLYYDETENKRVVYTYVGVKTVNDLMYNLTPTANTTYYCWEDNSLWLWMNKWIVLWSDRTYPSAYVYTDTGNIDPVYRYDQPLLPADDNGLLKDGSVVIRDRNRIIKGKLFIDDGNDNLVISSYLGGGIRILPNGQIDTDGEFYIGDEGKSFIRSEFHGLNNDMYVDYSENPDMDPSEYPNDTHIYKVFHEGNLNASAIKILTPQDIYNKLLDKSLPNPFEFNVKQLDGYTVDELAFKQHTHTSSQITDFNSQARSQALLEINSVFNSMQGEGVSIKYNNVNKNFTLTADDFVLNFTGGVRGTGIVRQLTDSTFNLIVDPNQHTHQNYIDRMDDIQEQIDNISALDPDNYYDKQEMDQKLTEVSGTTTPEAGRTLLVNEDLILPGTSESATKLSNNIDINLSGDITGTVTTDLSGNVNLITDASNILSDTAEIGKAVKVDDNGNLPVNATSSSSLNHNIQLNVQGDITGQWILDTSQNTITVNTLVNEDGNILSQNDLGITVASIDSSTGKIPASQLPDLGSGLQYQGYWNPETGAPSDNPLNQQFWIANTAGTFNDVYYSINDWCIYLNNEWNKMTPTQSVYSVNNKTGAVVLNSDDVGAISNEYINYTIGSEIPANKVVVTNANGQITGAGVDNLNNEFSLLSDSNGDVIFAEDSQNLNTNGSEDLNVRMQITESGYENIRNNAGYTLQNNGEILPYLNTINFGDGFNITQDDVGTNISLVNNHTNVINIYWDGKSVNDLFIIPDLYNNRANVPIILNARHGDDIVTYIIDDSYSDITADNLIITLIPNNFNLEVVNNSQSYLRDITKLIYNLKLTFSIGDNQVISLDNAEYMDDAIVLGTYVERTYVDNEINNISKIKLYTTTIKATVQDVPYEKQIQHNLNTSNLIIQFRDVVTNEEVYIENRIQDANNIVISATSSINIRVIILAI